MAHVLAIYEVDRAWGGPEEGGWWYDCGQLARIIAVIHDKERARTFCERADRLLQRLQRCKPSVDSAVYAGGRHTVIVFERVAPEFFPAQRPRYE
jgi:hypothetical protein